jgi:prepilin-type processing-associated H-X9-DG protein
LPPQDYSGQPETTPPSKMKILWNYQYDIPVNKGVVAIAFGDGHVESRSIKAPKIFDDVMAEE